MILDYNSVLVLGGSFNPPTSAHLQLMLHALHNTGAGVGVFVPSSENYVSRKCHKINESLIFSESDRREMLAALIQPYSNLYLELGEYGDDGKGRSYATMVRIQDQFPTRKCAFIIGADKLHIIPKWHSSDNFFNEFYFVVVSRNQEDTEHVIQSNEKLRRFRHKLIIISELSDDFKDISSTQVRHLLKLDPTVETELKLEAMLTPKVLQVVRKSMKSL